MFGLFVVNEMENASFRKNMVGMYERIVGNLNAKKEKIKTFSINLRA